MTSPINLNKARKAKMRADDKARADANAARHGRTKAQRLLEATQNEKMQQVLNSHRFEEE
ncbi:protein of unknown function [Cognatiyoonia koreensis]|uniref:DUF4169 domain-containing protein n=1 Tax=Cognatiyoonia koreensis TaxID=364200 RepID=A0A1I0PDE9_9RHOB|nr:DUF4169 family protein [Cognatiyoonia koreensis]SEW12170.1 protein of unknown function [Cognatiyoonia koreensis]